MKIKILALILCLAMMMTVLTACRDKESVPQDQNEVTENNDETEGNSETEEQPEMKEVQVEISENFGSGSKTDEEKIEDAIKSALLNEIVRKEVLGIVPDLNVVTPAEGHETLRTEVVDGKLYAYVTAQVSVTPKDGSEYTDSSVSAPFVLIFDIDDSGNYVYSDYKIPEDGGNFTDSLKEIFPEDLIEKATNADYSSDFYQDQIKSYLQ